MIFIVSELCIMDQFHFMNKYLSSSCEKLLSLREKWEKWENYEVIGFNGNMDS